MTATLQAARPVVVAAPRPPRRRLAILAWALVLTLLATFAVIVAIWQLRGGTWRIVATPSMGRAAPVGTLLWISPTRFSAIRVGELIAFHPPGERQVTFTHRVVEIGADGSLRTKGDINGTPDAWRLHAADVIGKVDARWWDVGWLLRALPVLLAGAVLIHALTRWCSPPQWRLPLQIAGAGFVSSVAIYVLKPLVHAETVSFDTTGSGARAQLVGTGILPVRATPVGGRTVVGAPGQLVNVVLDQVDGRGQYTVRVGAHVPWWWFVIAAVVIFSPSIYRVCAAASSPRAMRHAAGG